VTTQLVRLEFRKVNVLMRPCFVELTGSGLGILVPLHAGLSRRY